jgi:hypothetical protein
MPTPARSNAPTRLALIALPATVIALALGLSAQGAMANEGHRGGSRGHDGHRYWRPGPTIGAWQWQLQGVIDTSIAADVYDVDGFAHELMHAFDFAIVEQCFQYHECDL